MNYSQHDELAALFAQRMNFASSDQNQQIQRRPDTQAYVQPAQLSEKQSEEPVHFISSHYAHTAHIRHDTTSESSGSPPPPYHENSMPEAMAQILRDHSIDPASLLPNQIHLFANADYEQRLRLLELWRISPPSYPLEQHMSNDTPTSLEQEEFQARERYDKKMQDRQMHFDTHIEPNPITAIREAHEPAFPPAARMRAASIASSRPQTRHGGGDAEPYMTAGYQTADQPRSSSMDPVYGAAAGLWQAPSYAHAQQQTAMEDQYGAYQQIRNHADWEAMNERVAREKFGMVYHPGAAAGGDGDDDMEL